MQTEERMQTYASPYACLPFNILLVCMPSPCCLVCRCPVPVLPVHVDHHRWSARHTTHATDTCLVLTCTSTQHMRYMACEHTCLQWQQHRLLTTKLQGGRTGRVSVKGGGACSTNKTLNDVFHYRTLEMHTKCNVQM